MQKITTFLTFKEKGEEAVNFYVSIFKNSKINHAMSIEGKLVHASFTLDGQDFMAMDGGPVFSMAQGMSLFVNCETQEEVDELWEKLSVGGEKGRCGWLTDKYGVSWQIIPSALGQLMMSGDAATSARVREAMLKMNKIEIQGLQQAYDGK